MTNTTPESRIRNIHEEYKEFYRIGGGLLLILCGVWIGSLLFGADYATNVYTESLSVIATIAVLDRLNDWRETRRLKRRLIREAGSRDNSTALNAIDWMRAENWVTIDDREALLYEKKLARANLEQAYLYEVNLARTNLYKANLASADLSRANLMGAFLHRADLKYTSVFGTDFRDAILWNTELCDVKYIKEARFNERTVLPDARPIYDVDGNMTVNTEGEYVFDKYWTPEIDMTRYTNPEHRDFWQP